ncbi:hypothetical protein M9H77_16056 [Catharanthus roseus]|uniref:Uncharacterized protein n=1 Tax=Catharanthus roseus TaxID=4058 RepID=A0ACC0B180_CATRO|nr:hypothetical protein M9H77_16056 [Catharanthus roseus]
MDCSPNSRGLRDICRGKNLNLKLMVPFNRRCCGSSYGWLAFAMNDLSIILFNPFTGRKLKLPSLGVKPRYKSQYFVMKVILSSNPSLDPKNFEAAAIYGGMNRVAHIKSGQEAWTTLPGKFKGNTFPIVAADVIYHQNLIYFVDHYKQILSASSAMNRWRMEKKRTNDVCHFAYLVESSRGELYMIRRFLSYESSEEEDEEPVGKTLKFEVYKMENSQLKAVNELEGDAFFLGDNQSMAVVASDFPGCRPNCIYSTDDYILFYYRKGPFDMGIYNLKDGSFEMHYEPKPDLHKTMPPPIWITPTPK